MSRKKAHHSWNKKPQLADDYCTVFHFVDIIIVCPRPDSVTTVASAAGVFSVQQTDCLEAVLLCHRPDATVLHSCYDLKPVNA